jgi:hypothetical protein
MKARTLHVLLEGVYSVSLKILSPFNVDKVNDSSNNNNNSLNKTEVINNKNGLIFLRQSVRKVIL